MKVEFRFNGTNSLVLIPETSTEKTLLQIFRTDADTLSISSTEVSPEAMKLVVKDRKSDSRKSDSIA